MDYRNSSHRVSYDETRLYVVNYIGKYRKPYEKIKTNSSK